MPSPFNRTPRGLLGLLDAKIGGRNPQELAEQIGGMLNMLPFYFAQLRETISAQTAANLVVGQNLLPAAQGAQCPNDEIWLVEQYSCKADAGVPGGGLVCLTAMVGVVLGALTVPVTLTASKILANQVNWIAASCAQRPFLMLPGDTLGIWVDTLNVLATTGTGIATVAKLKI